MFCTDGHAFYHSWCGYCQMAQRDYEVRRTRQEAQKQTAMMRDHFKQQQRAQRRAADRQRAAEAERARVARSQARRAWMEENHPDVVAAHTRAKTALIWTAVVIVAFGVFAQLFASFFWIFVLVGALVVAVLYLQRRGNSGPGDDTRPPGDGEQ